MYNNLISPLNKGERFMSIAVAWFINLKKITKLRTSDLDAVWPML